MQRGWGGLLTKLDLFINKSFEEPREFLVMQEFLQSLTRCPSLRSLSMRYWWREPTDANMEGGLTTDHLTLLVSQAKLHYCYVGREKIQHLDQTLGGPTGKNFLKVVSDNEPDAEDEELAEVVKGRPKMSLA